MSFAERLKSLREERGLYQRDLAEKLNLSVPTISGYELGVKKPKMKTLKAIADFFGVTTDYLLDNDRTISELEKDFPDGVYLLRRASKKLTEEEKEKLVQIMRAFLNE